MNNNLRSHWIAHLAGRSRCLLLRLDRHYRAGKFGFGHHRSDQYVIRARLRVQSGRSYWYPVQKHCTVVRLRTVEVFDILGVGSCRRWHHKWRRVALSSLERQRMILVHLSCNYFSQQNCLLSHCFSPRNGILKVRVCKLLLHELVELREVGPKVTVDRKAEKELKHEYWLNTRQRKE